MQRDYVQWHSPHLNRPMEFLWFGWSGRPLILFPTSAGRFYENEDFHLVSSLRDKIEEGQIQVICVDTVNSESWYNRHVHPHHRIVRHEQYDDYLRWELVPYINHRAQRGDLDVYGASFGAYHASNFAGKHPDVVTKAILFSGVYDVYSFLDGYWNDAAYFNCPLAFIGGIWNGSEQAARLASVDWVIATGEHDTLVQKNREFSELLWMKGIPNYFELWPGQFGHDWPWWREHLRRFVP